MGATGEKKGDKIIRRRGEHWWRGKQQEGREEERSRGRWGGGRSEV